jgi:hypothetical protein
MSRPTVLLVVVAEVTEPRRFGRVHGAEGFGGSVVG